MQLGQWGHQPPIGQVTEVLPPGAESKCFSPHKRYEESPQGKTPKILENVSTSITQTDVQQC